MTVRTWFTISALVLAALAAAFAYRVLAPVPVPGIRVSVGEVQLDGSRVASCWPRRGGDIDCERPEASATRARRLPRKGILRINATSPVPPKGGRIHIRSEETGDTALRSTWNRRLPYAFDPGGYVLEAEARYSEQVYVRYRFRFTVTRSGS